MSEQITSKIVGLLTKDDEGVWISNPIAIPFFDDEEIAITYSGFYPDEEPDFLKIADRVIANFLEKTEKDRLSISALVYKNCTDELVGLSTDDVDDKEVLNIEDETEVWDFITPYEIYVGKYSEPYTDFYVWIDCECAWAIEHGLRLVFKNGVQLTQVLGQE